jgi:hypothetical protein
MFEMFMCSKVALGWHYRNITIIQGPFVGIERFRFEVHEFSGEPIVRSSVRIMTLIKFFHPVRACLPAYFDAFELIPFQWRNIYVKTNSLRQSVF